MAASQAVLMMILSVVVLVRGDDEVGTVEPLGAIIGGHEIHISRVPWQVFLNLGDGEYCGGVIISERWVLTARHCTEDVQASRMQLRIGSSSRLDGGRVYRVEQVVNHDNYYKKTIFNDISALKTASNIQFGDSARAVTLPKMGETRPFVGTPVRVSGWGLMEGRQKPTMLRAVDIHIVNVSVCKKYFKVTNETTMICAGTETKKFCDGDSGSPLVTRHGLLVGLASYSNAPCTSPADVYTDVAAYRGWIREKTGL